MHFTSKPHRLVIATLAVLLMGHGSSWCQTAKSGIAGVVVQIGHAGPSRAGQVYTGPLQVMRLSDGMLAGTTASDEKGKFTIALEPGKYFITQSDPRLSKIHSTPITVEKDKFTPVTIYADNRMR
jgi:hypothetical protein